MSDSEFVRDDIPDLDKAVDRWHDIGSRIDPDTIAQLRMIAAINTMSDLDLSDD